MAKVPNTTTFTLQDVVDIVNPTTDDLVDCFAEAVTEHFNPTYVGDGDNLYSFRDYGAPIIYSITCLDNPHNFPQTGDTVSFGVLTEPDSGTWEIYSVVADGNLQSTTMIDNSTITKVSDISLEITLESNDFYSSAGANITLRHTVDTSKTVVLRITQSSL